MGSNIEVSRIMRPDDSNFAGNVHGGTILKLIEEAGVIIATRHCNKAAEELKQPDCFAALVRVERTDFVQPMYIGEIAQIHAELSYASTHSVEVRCTVYAENVVKAERRLTNRASLWYVPVTIAVPHNVCSVPPLQYPSQHHEEQGRMRYELQKQARKVDADTSSQMEDDSMPGKVSSLSPQDRLSAPAHSCLYSQSQLVLQVHPSDCNQYGYAYGGFTMKIMDDVAGNVAFRHCRTNVVTACIDALNFHIPVRLGHVMSITGRITFTSERSLEVEVLVDVEDIVQGKCFRACTAMFTFVSLTSDRLPAPVPQLVVQTEAEKKRFEKGKQRYMHKKLKRKQQANDEG